MKISEVIKLILIESLILSSLIVVPIIIFLVMFFCEYYDIKDLGDDILVGVKVT